MAERGGFEPIRTVISWFMLIYTVIRETLKNQRVRVKAAVFTAFAELLFF